MASKSQVQSMFQTISPTYDFLNSLLSFNLDKYWRKKTVDLIRPIWQQQPNALILDLCSGTLDLSIQILKQSGPKTKIFALDFSSRMLNEGKKKIPEGDRDRIRLICADIEHLPLRDNVAEAAVMGFGLRNLIDRHQGLREIKRVLKPSGRLAVLEFSQPRSRFFRAIYYFYSLYILPLIGGLISGNINAYRYLPDSVRKFYTPDQLQQIMEQIGYRKVAFSLLTAGIVALHVGEKDRAR
ncbi:MAG: bifunctional demethylmenaquinone methyltransferase/2-methoxy-6-polyprenyl-1,4-benzoquinol methylase UbiE [bacterium]|nr:bifunctional demethylmenaquinone methyltransferase/2-methoxy-6-polyprenyl-1,4-benzoquinol methylase UbiE [bacterium]